MTVLHICLTTSLLCSPLLQCGWLLNLCLFRDTKHTFPCMFSSASVYDKSKMFMKRWRQHTLFSFCSVAVGCSLAGTPDQRCLMTAYTGAWLSSAVFATAGFFLVARGGCDVGIFAALEEGFSFRLEQWVCRKSVEETLPLGRSGIIWLDISYDTKTQDKI